MAMVNRGSVRFGSDFVAGFRYNTETLQITHVGGRNNGTGTGFVSVTKDGVTRSRTFDPESGVFTANVESLNWFVTRDDWGRGDRPEWDAIEGSYV